MGQVSSTSSSSRLLVNRYQLGTLIGRGGMGQVFLAEDILLGGVQVAIKFLSQTLINAQMQQEFAREARTCAQLGQKSIHIVRVMDYGVSEEGNPFYVMEYLRGQCLKELIPLPLPMFLTLSRQICLGLQCAHQGINIDGRNCLVVHRDIKPANVLIVPDPMLGQLAKVLDFGIAKFLSDQATMTRTHAFLGTLPYCSPEQMDGGKLDSRSDIYSLGVMMFEMLAGRKPWQPETDSFGSWYKAHHFEPPRSLSEVSPHLRLPKDLRNLIGACMAKPASDRPQTIGEVLKALELLGKLGSADPPPPPPKSVVPLPQETKTAAPPKTTQLSNWLASRGSQLPLPVEQACWKVLWPKDKPIDEIVFPHLLYTSQGIFTALWLMMSKQEIRSRGSCRRHNEFIFIKSPHPMLLWVTVLYSRALGPKWLPCYLDMQSPQNQEIIRSFATGERYPLILFTLEKPHSCANVTSSFISTSQRQKLQDWADLSQKLAPSSLAPASRNILKKQYNDLKLKMMLYLESLPDAPKLELPAARNHVF